MKREILRLRCVRCGDWHERDAGDPYLPELCVRCFSLMLERAHEHGNYGAGLGRYIDRYRRGTERHPTVLALAEMWERLYPPGNAEVPW